MRVPRREDQLCACHLSEVGSGAARVKPNLRAPEVSLLLSAREMFCALRNFYGNAERESVKHLWNECEVSALSRNIFSSAVLTRLR